MQARPKVARLLIQAILDAEETPVIHSAAARSLADAGDADLARKLLGHWTTYRINLRCELIGALVRNAELGTVLIESLEAGTMTLAELDLSAGSATPRSRQGLAGPRRETFDVIRRQRP